MLWQKESNKNESMFVDIFALNGGKSFSKQFIDVRRRNGTPSSKFNKNDAMSLQKRIEGNKYFNKSNWKIAMETYSESLCYAENDSINFSLAYANRASCFLKMKLYNECLIDIELAKEAGYPSNLMPKLVRRKEQCLKDIDEESAASVRFISELSFESDEHFPCMANVLKIERDAEGNLALFAREDIDVGQTIVKEKPLITYLYWRHGWQCNICLKGYVNLVPCKKCTVAMFCSEECRSCSLHDYECGLRFCEKDLANGTIMRIVRSCLLAINMFSGTDELMSFVEKTISSDRNQIPATLSDSKSQYAAILKLPMNTANRDPDEFKLVLAVAFGAQKMLMKIPQMNSMFELEKYR